MIGKIGSSVAGMIFVGGLANESLQASQKIKDIFAKKSEISSESINAPSSKVISDSSVTLSKPFVEGEKTDEVVPSPSTQENSSAPTGEGEETKGKAPFVAPPSSENQTPVLNKSWMNTLDWAAVAKVTTAALIALGIVGAGIMYVMGSKK